MEIGISVMLAGADATGADWEALLGAAIAGAALAVLLTLVVWSRWSINRIARKGLSSAREIIKDRAGD